MTTHDPYAAADQQDQLKQEQAHQKQLAVDILVESIMDDATRLGEVIGDYAALNDSWDEYDKLVRRVATAPLNSMDEFIERVVKLQMYIEKAVREQATSAIDKLHQFTTAKLNKQ